MTYASIEEAWGGISGSNMLTTPLYKKEHPVHQKQKQNPDSGIYQCTYGSQHCNQVVNRNNKFNNQKKAIAAGMQEPPIMTYPFTYLPQYPWYPVPKEQYLNYTPIISSMWYNYPWLYDPVVAQEILQHQTRIVPTGPYHPQGFGPPYKQKVEKFTDENFHPVRNGMIYLIFFLIAIAVILVIALICLCSIKK